MYNLVYFLGISKVELIRLVGLVEGHNLGPFSSYLASYAGLAAFVC